MLDQTRLISRTSLRFTLHHQEQEPRRCLQTHALMLPTNHPFWRNSLMPSLKLQYFVLGSETPVGDLVGSLHNKHQLILRAVRYFVRTLVGQRPASLVISLTLTD